jgi:hypothetical protein
MSKDEEIALLKAKLTELSDHCDMLATANKVATDEYSCLLMDFYDLKDQLTQCKYGAR